MAERDANQLAADALAGLPDLEQNIRDNEGEVVIVVGINYAKALVGLVGTLQQERDRNLDAGLRAVARMEAAEAALAQAETWDGRTRAAWDEEVNKRIAAEAALATTRQALTDIADLEYSDESRSVRDLAANIARRALADTGGDTAPRYDKERREWVGQCPHGDDCTGCDALGYCTREEAVS